MMTVALTNLALHPVTLYGTFEMPFRDTDQDLNRFFAFFPFLLHIYNSQRKGRGALATAFAEELLYQRPADDTLSLVECRRCGSRHPIYIIRCTTPDSRSGSVAKHLSLKDISP